MHLPFDILKKEQDGSFRWFEAANDLGSAPQQIQPPEPIPQPAPEPAPEPEPAPPTPQYDSDPKDRAVHFFQNQTARLGSGHQMPAPEQKVVHCPCGANLLLRWTWSTGSAIFRLRCPGCRAEHEVRATPPIELHCLDAHGNWEYVTTIGSEPT